MPLTPEQLADLRREPATPNRLKAAMRLARVTQVQVAAAIGVTQSHISEIANGNYSSLPLDTAQDIAGFFGPDVTTDDIFPSRIAVAS